MSEIFEIVSLNYEMPMIYYLGLFFLFLIIYFIPGIIRSFYGGESIKFYIINLLLGRTPLPYIILILDIMKQYKNEILEEIQEEREKKLEFKISNNFNTDKKQS